ncbi:LANO_0H11650g1_1 [Lachancea nothofagi CBS 11611]|uniref:Arginine N-methyltransferase 2 n=1 Tax=Lachancea nothofagi CBS 11611 TaxID=1266666 RepID=A0A1G4KM82_9SACH|nr:LANO_0H11650g1_1 [Lachancea nothofagi CBS 11611]
MSNLHDLLTLETSPIDESYVEKLTALLKSGIPATYTIEQVAAHEAGKDDVEDTGSNTTPLHVLIRSLPDELSREENLVVLKLMDVLFEYGAGWNFLDYENKSPGDLLFERGMKNGNALYERVVDAGVSAELLLRKLNDDIEFLDEEDLEDPEDTEETEEPSEDPEASTESLESAGDTAEHQDTYLKADLEYTANALITKDNKDGVMMDWESDIMRLARDSMFKNATSDSVVLNIGFGMGIIDRFIQERQPAQHYICEAHPDVLKHMRDEGWFEKPNVVVLEGRWQDTLSTLLDDGSVFFDAIYYDTFSEHYSDMLDLYDTIVGLIKPEGLFSFFNGLGADRQVCYDVYKKVVEMDVANYGMKCNFTTIPLPRDPNWEDVRRSYFACDRYYHPEIRFA